MALKLADRIKEQSNTTGLGPFHMNGAVVGFAAASSVLNDGDQAYFAATDNASVWVVFLGTFAAAANTVAVTTVLASSPGYAGFTVAPQIWIDAPAALLSKLLTTTGTGILVAQTNPYISGQLVVGDDVTFTTQGPLNVSLAQNATSQLRVRNNNTGTAAASGFMAANSGANTLAMYQLGTGYTASGIFRPDGGLIAESGPGGLMIGTSVAQPLYFMTSQTERGRIAIGGQFLLGNPNPITDTAANSVDVTANFNSGAVYKITNQNAGNAAYAGLYVQNDAGDNMFLSLYSSGIAAGNWLTKPHGAVLWTSGSGGLTLGTNGGNYPIYFAINGYVIGEFVPYGPGAFLQVDSQFTGNGPVLQLKNSTASSNNMRFGIAGGASSLINGDALHDGGIWLTNGGGSINFSTDSGNTMAGSIRIGGYLAMRGGYAGGYATNCNLMYNTVGSNNSVLGLIHENASTQCGCQALYVATPNNAGNPFFQAMDGYGTTYGGKFSAYSNGGLGNFSANNVNFSDARAKHSIERHRDNPKLWAQLWDAFQQVDWGRFKFTDQTHDDYNYGYTAQGVHAAFGHIADLTEDWNAGFVVHDRNTDELVDHEPRLAIYDHDLENIGRAVLAMAQARIEALEAKIAKLETRH